MEYHLESSLRIIRRALVSNDLEVSVAMANVIGNALLLAKSEEDSEFSYALLTIFKEWLDFDITDARERDRDANILNYEDDEE